jgi:hypothetical protein
MSPTRAISLTLIVALSACGGQAQPPYQAVADVKQLMISVVEPAADEYWDAVGAIIDDKGTTEFQPETNEEWEAVRNHAYVIAESGNLLMMSTRAKDSGDWMTMSQSLIAAGRRAVRAAEARSAPAVFDAGGELYEACTTCHEKYAAQLARPNAQ